MIEASVTAVDTTVIRAKLVLAAGIRIKSVVGTTTMLNMRREKGKESAQGAEFKNITIKYGVDRTHWLMVMASRPPRGWILVVTVITSTTMFIGVSWASLMALTDSPTYMMDDTRALSRLQFHLKDRRDPKHLYPFITKELVPSRFSIEKSGRCIHIY